MPRQLRVQVPLCVHGLPLKLGSRHCLPTLLIILFSNHLKAFRLSSNLWPLPSNICLPTPSLWLCLLDHKVEAFRYWVVEFSTFRIYSNTCEVFAPPFFPSITMQEASFPLIFLVFSGPYIWPLSQELLICPISPLCLLSLNFSLYWILPSILLKYPIFFLLRESVPLSSP